MHSERPYGHRSGKFFLTKHYVLHLILNQNSILMGVFQATFFRKTIRSTFFCRFCDFGFKIGVIFLQKRPKIAHLCKKVTLYASVRGWDPCRFVPYILMVILICGLPEKARENMFKTVILSCYQQFICYGFWWKVPDLIFWSYFSPRIRVLQMILRSKWLAFFTIQIY